MRGSFLVLVFLTGCDLFTPRVDGLLTARGGAFGDLDVRLVDCPSGEHYAFNGVDLYVRGNNVWAVRLDRGPEGFRVHVAVPGQDKAIVFRQANCRTFDVDVHQSNRMKNRRDGMDGSLSVDCAYPGEEQLVGTVTFANCF